ncbi:rhamnulokinase [Streptomyces iconiensis]|uniref:Rhamnulokinase family protein n=1 Tax=Streptomyces iconiensis TaxID=1384038 RepID=A0ABT7A6P9_9ACTN|nr:rhamnulokinase family protein [Streptomyces iconiensis]MDJ1136303.1 rhamnulokinase family protein [Streptomyces iconiensis]
MPPSATSSPAPAAHGGTGAAGTEVAGSTAYATGTARTGAAGSGTPAGGAFAAVDLGASSGRVILGRTTDGVLTLEEVHRFENRPVHVAGTLHWDILGLYRGVLDGLRAAGAAAGTEPGALASVGIDSWGVDYGLLDADGALLGNPVHYRDDRTLGMAEEIEKALPARELYALTGLQRLPINTLYQLAAARGSSQLAAARRILLVPDLISYWLTGRAGTEITIASTTQLLDPRTRTWSAPVAGAVGLDPALFAPLRSPGEAAGELLPGVLEETGLAGPVPVTAVGAHDTASAVVGVPAADERFAYISTGTWSLAGVELEAPVLTEESRRANFTNELGVDGTVRYLRNIMGLWLLQECLRDWETGSGPYELDALLEGAARMPGLRSVVDASSPAFLAPGGMPARLAEACRATGQPVPRDPAETTRCVLDSLALAHRETVTEAARLSGREVETVHMVGGGARNALLCQLTADACGLPVVAGPVEAAAYGNVLVQARTAGAVSGGLPSLRRLVRDSLRLRQYAPRGDQASWALAAARVRGHGKEAPCA